MAIGRYYNGKDVKIYSNNNENDEVRLNCYRVYLPFVTQFWKISLNVTLKYVKLHNLL